MEEAYLFDRAQVLLAVGEVASFRFFAVEAWISNEVPCAQLRQRVVLYLRFGMLSM